MEVKPFPLYPKSDPKFYYSPNKIPGSPLVVFVHFYGGHQKVLKRHINLVNELGYDAFAYNMPQFAGLKLSILYKGRIGLKHLYSRMLSYFLEQIEGQKIIFSSSNPSASAIEVIYDRTKENKNDVVGLICDSGPSQAFVRSAWNLAIKLKGEYKLMLLFMGFWSFRLHQEIRYQLRRFPLQFPILSIRGGKDSVIPAWHIEKVFKNLEAYVKMTPVTYPEAGHLDACKLNTAEYKQNLEQWLKSEFKNFSDPSGLSY